MQPETKNELSQEETLRLLRETLNAVNHQKSQTTPPPAPPSRPAPAPLDGALDVEQIDLFQIFSALKKRIVLIIFAALLGGILSFVYTTQLVTPMYQASIQMIVNARPETINSAAQTTVGDVTSAKNLVATYATVIKSNRVMEHVDSTLGLNMGWKRINDMVAVRPVDDTPVINIIVTCSDPELSRSIVTAISEYAPEKIVEAVEAGSCRVISDADCPGEPISPNVVRNVQMGLLLGAALAAGVVILLYMLDDAIYSEEQLADLSPMPVLGVIPMAGSKTGHSKYSYGYRKKSKNEYKSKNGIKAGK